MIVFKEESGIVRNGIWNMDIEDRQVDQVDQIKLYYIMANLLHFQEGRYEIRQEFNLLRAQRIPHRLQYDNHSQSPLVRSIQLYINNNKHHNNNNNKRKNDDEYKHQQKREEMEMEMNDFLTFLRFLFVC